MRLQRMFGLPPVALIVVTATILTSGSPQAAVSPRLALNAASSDGYVFKNAANDKCLDAEANSGWNGTKVQLWDRNGGPQQHWLLVVQRLGDEYFMLQNALFPWLCRNADNSSGITYPNGARVQLWDCQEVTTNALWRNDYVAGAWSLTTRANPNMVLDGDISQGTYVNGMKAQMYDNLGRGQLNQWWFPFVTIGG